jgi:hypothetical protein
MLALMAQWQPGSGNLNKNNLLQKTSTVIYSQQRPCAREATARPRNGGTHPLCGLATCQPIGAPAAPAAPDAIRQSRAPCRVSREMFPKILEQLADRGVIEITVTDEDVSLRMPNAPQLDVYRVEQNGTLH